MLKMAPTPTITNNSRMSIMLIKDAKEKKWKETTYKKIMHIEIIIIIIFEWSD